jgi:hypothetical protein
MALTDFVAGQVLTAQQLDDSFAAVDWNENVVINGAMQVAQRGTSTTGITAGGYYTADRFALGITTMGTWTQSQETDAPAGSGFRNSTKLLCTTADAAPAAADFLQFQQSLEGQNLQQFAKGTALAKTFNLSFWVKSNVTGTYVAMLVDADNTRQVGAQYTINAPATWEKKTITFPADTTGAFDNDSNGSLVLRWYLGAGTDRTSGTLRTTWSATVTADLAVGQTNVAAATNNYWQVTGVQLQPERASQFAFMDYGTVLAQCQRYYQRVFPAAVSKGLAFGSNYSTTQNRCAISFPTTMRTAPTALETTGTANQYATFQAGAGATVASAVPTFAEADTGRITVTGTVAAGLTNFAPSYIYTDPTNGATAYLGWSAEL